MPIFAYRCASCGFEQDVLQKRTDPPLATCPSCGQDSFAKRLTAPAFQLKGNGWYVTDFRDKGKAKQGESAQSGSSGGAPAKSGGDAGKSADAGNGGGSSSGAADTAASSASAAGAAGASSASGKSSGAAPAAGNG